MSLPVAVLAGGFARRLGPLTERVPKILVDIEGRPFAEYQIQLLARQGIRDVVFCVGHLADQVKHALGDGDRWDMRFAYVSDGDRLLGTGGALRKALPFLGEAFFVLYGDSYLECDFSAVERAFVEGGRPGLMAVFRNDDRWDRSNVQFEDGRIVRYDKTNRDERMRHIDYGLGVLTPHAFEPWADTPAPFDLAAVYQALVVRGELVGFEVAERFYEIGSVAGIEALREHLGRDGRA